MSWFYSAVEISK